MEGITVDGGGGLRVGAGEEKVRDSVLVLRLTDVGTYSLFMDSDQTFHAIVLEYIRLADRPRFLVDAWSQRTMALLLANNILNPRFKSVLISSRFKSVLILNQSIQIRTIAAREQIC